MKRLISAVIITALLIVQPGIPLIQVSAGETSFANTNTGKATKIFLDSMQQFFEDSKALQGKTDKEKVEYILDKGGGRIIAKTAEAAREIYKKKLTKYAEANLRARLFKEIAIPKITHQYIMKGKLSRINWAQIDAEIGSAHALDMRKFNVAMKGIEISANVLSVLYYQGPEKSIKALATSLGDEICGWLIPGWGWYRMAQGLVIALGEYVTGYAFSTSLEAKIRDICPIDPKADPQGYSQWLLGLNDIPGFVSREWDEQLAYSGWYLKVDGKVKTHEEMGDNMKNKIIAELTKMQNGLKKQQEKFNQLQKKIAAKQEKIDNQAKAAHDDFQQSMLKEFLKAQPFLDQIAAFRKEYPKVQKQDVVNEIAELTAAQPKVSAYSPINKNEILSALDALCDLVSLSKGGFEYKAIMSAYDEYTSVFFKEVKGCWNTNEAESRELDEPNLSRTKAFYSDLAMLQAEQHLRVLETTEKIANFGLSEKIEQLQKEYKTARHKYQSAEDAIMIEITSGLSYPKAVYDKDFFKNKAESMSAMMPPYLSQKRFVLARDDLMDMKQKAASDAQKVKELISKEKKIKQEYEIKVLNIRNQFESAVPEALRTYGAKNSNGDTFALGIEDFYFPGIFMNLDAEMIRTRQRTANGGWLPGFLRDFRNEDTLRIVKKIEPVYVDTTVPLNIIQKVDYAETNRLLAAAISKIDYISASEASSIRMLDLMRKMSAAFDSILPQQGSVMNIESVLKEFSLPLESSSGYQQMMKLNLYWDSAQALFKQISGLEKKLTKAQQLELSSCSDITAYHNIIDAVPRMIKIYKDAYSQAKERKILADLEEDFAAIRDIRDIKKQKEKLDSLRKQIDKETFSFERSREKALTDSLLKLKKDVDEKFTMMGGSSVGAGGTSSSSEETTLVQEAITALANAYEQRDVNKFTRYVSAQFVGGKSMLEQGIRSDFDLFSSLNLKLYVQRVDIRKDKAVVDITWEKNTITNKTGTPMSMSGKTTLTLMPDAGRMMIQGMRGDLLYACMSPEIAEVSGLSMDKIALIRKARDDRDPLILDEFQNKSVSEPAQPPASNTGLMVRTATISKLHNSFDFSSGNELPGGIGDFTLIGGVLVGNGAALIREVPIDFNNLNVAPDSGYKKSCLLKDRGTYCFTTKSGCYGKIKIGNAMDIPFHMQYAVQQNHSRNLKTQ